MNPPKICTPPVVLENGMDLELVFQPKENLALGVNKLPNRIPSPRDGPMDLYVDIGFEPPKMNMGMILIVELYPLLNMNGGTIVLNVRKLMLCIPNGKKWSWISFLIGENSLRGKCGDSKCSIQRMYRIFLEGSYNDTRCGYT